MTGTRCKSIRGKVAVRKNALDREDTESDEADEVIEEPTAPTTKKQSKPASVTRSKVTTIEVTDAEPATKVKSPAISVTVDASPVKDAPEDTKLHSKEQILCTAAAAELWANAEKLQLNKRERKALLKEREQLLKRVQPILDDPLADEQ